MSATVVTQSQPRSQRGQGKRGNNRGRRGSRGAGQAQGARPAVQDTNKPGEVTTVPVIVTLDDQDQVGDDEVALCWICAEPVKYYAVSECNHRTCHVCSLRLRALYKKNDCTFCKDPQPTIMFTTSPDALFASFDTAVNTPWKDAKLSIHFETQEMMEETLLLLRFNCPDTECDYIGNSWSDLKLHVRATHGRLMCDLCIRHKKVFAHEHTLYPPNILPLHLPSMLAHQRNHNKNDVKGAGKGKDREQIEGGTHPLCEFCRECYFGDDELFGHMRETHEECFVCKREGVRDQYFLNYPALEAHFTQAHHPCPYPACLARKFVVFPSVLDLQAHAVEEHAAEMDKSAGGRGGRGARRVVVEAGWDEVPRPGQGRGGHRGRDGGHRERDGGREQPRDAGRGGGRDAPPHQPVQAQVQTQPQPQPPPRPGGGRRREGFGASLTVEGEAAPTPTPSPPPVRTDVDPAMAERHAAFLSRLASLSPNPSTALPAARAAIRSFRTNESPARDLVSTLYSIVSGGAQGGQERHMESAASVVNGLVDLLDEGDQREALLAAWRGWEVEQRRQFPDLVPSAVVAGAGYAGITSGRVLNAKHATATAGRRGAQVWDRVAQAASASASASHPAASSSSAFPAPVFGKSSTPGRATGQRSTPWASGSGRPTQPTGFAASSSFVPLSFAGTNGSSSNVPTPYSTPGAGAGAGSGGKVGAPPKLSNALFPELPPSAAARTKAVGAAWGAGGTGANGAAVNEEEGATVAGGGGGKKKGKGKNKQTLFTLGTFPS
ncbi:hypothetical protein C8F04DRAFT_1218783 [Mycena alexandri]|uniref:RING-type E3 ubiquitin transferase n=1 Tax=Mycena alexandri TaxID=1745969 RepID=A0AAD6TDD6_9AGAR|nr:hypothetical protein C8F04DRAFT_1218783 [Mycena alexandri]